MIVWSDFSKMVGFVGSFSNNNRDELIALQLHCENSFMSVITAMNLEDSLREIQTIDLDTLYLDTLSNFQLYNDHLTLTF
ncbi:MAG: hypothetical protein AAGD43_19450 [Pseudomonadota bacterium]